MDTKDKNEKLGQAAQEMFNKSFEECEPHERVRVGGKVGGGIRGGELADPDRAPEPPKVKFGEDNPVGEDRAAEQPGGIARAAHSPSGA